MTIINIKLRNVNKDDEIKKVLWLMKCGNVA